MVLAEVVLVVLAGVVAAAVVLRRRRTAAADPIAVACADAERIREAVDFVTAWELERLPLYAEAAERLRAAAPPTADLLPLAQGPDEVLACLALRALRGRDDLPADWVDTVLARLARSGYADELELLATIAERRGRLIGPVLARCRHLTPNTLAWFLERRAAHGEPLDDTTFAELPDEVGARGDEYLESADSVPAAVRDAFRTWWRPRASRQYLRGFAKLWPAPFDQPPAALVGSRPDVVETVAAALAGEERRSVVLIGEHGVGKTRLIAAGLARAGGDPLVFEASAAMVNAGAMYVGQLEGRVQELVSRLVGLDAVWVLPNLEHVLWAGQTTTTPAGLLDALLPHIASGGLVIAGETSPAGWEVLIKARPAVASAFVPIRVRPLAEPDAIAVAADALHHDGHEITAPAGVMREAYELTQQFLPAGGQPSALVRVVRAAAEVAREAGDGEIASRHLLAVLAEVTALPLAMLDAATPLDVAGVRAHLGARVIGQPEAVEALVERIAMIKAGVTDPSRPLGVFLFVGPTGTGKTELAKALAELVFGSAGRLVRLDMSEFQTPASLERLLSDASQDAHAAPLLAAVRKDPFAVVLLDEFEKAAEPVWDLFLQVFDDGRLTDLQGRTVDFRRCVFILTSNMGAAIARGARLGFDRAAQAFNPDAVRRSIESAFRPEFLNRIDRVVVFRPFERADMRALLEIELRQVVQRRGLRARPWAIEYDETALRFLIDRGFSPELGARPLKRAVERYLLAPLAEAIVEQAVPSGEQFMFVTAGREALAVTFVDPDADEAGAPVEPGPGDVTDVRRLARSPDGGADAVRVLLGALARIAAAVRAEPIASRKAAALEALGRDGFWEDPGRHALLSEAHYIDRLEEAVRTAERLGARLERAAERRGGSADLAGLLALRLHVVERALEGLDEGAPDELFLRIRPSGDDGEGAFAARLAAMYVGWAQRRAMLCRPVDGEPSHVLLLGGLGAAVLLLPERGLHVFEAKEGAARVAASVEVAARPPSTVDERDLAGLAERCLGDGAGGTTIVRRYRGGSAPLVRDSVRGYRTGRLDQVLAGDFDLF